MCDGAKKLIAWFDGELPGEEAAAVERRVLACAQCRRELARFRKISKQLDAYSDAIMMAEAHGGRPTWATAAVSAGVAAAAIAAFLLFPHRPAQKLAAGLSTPLAAPLVAHLAGPLATAPIAAIPADIPAPPRVRVVLAKRIRSRTAPSPKPEPSVPQQAQPLPWQLREPLIEVAIPAEAMFAPGAVPEGMAFVAEMSIAPDGSVGQFRLGP